MKIKRASAMVGDQTVSWILYIMIFLAIAAALYLGFKGIF
jgi:hypothetical protein